MFDNNDHPENKPPKKGDFDYIKEVTDISKLAKHTANLTEHLGHLSGLISALAHEVQAQRESFDELRDLILRYCEDDDEDDIDINLN